MNTEGTKSGWSATAKGFLGAGLVAMAGFFGTAAMNVLSAPKDSVAYDLVQSLTGMLKSKNAPSPAQPAPVAAAPEVPKTEAPKPSERQTAFIPQPTVPTIPAPETSPPPPAPASPPPQPQAPHGAPPAQAEAPAPSSPAPGGVADRMRQTTELTRKMAAANAALAGSRVLSLNDRAETSICGANYRLEVTSVVANQGAIELRGAGADPVTLTRGQSRELGIGCRVELLLAMEDLENRRAQLRETKGP